jgi:HEAT repeat protein
LLRDFDREVQAVAARAIFEVASRAQTLDGAGWDMAVTQLAVTLAHSDHDVRRLAAAALTKLDPDWARSAPARRAIPELKLALESADYWIRQAAADALGRIGQFKARSPEPSERLGAEAQRHRMILAALLDALHDPDPQMRQAAAETLGRLSDARTVPALMQALPETDPGVRQAVIQALLQLGAPPELLRAGGVEAPAPASN